MSPTHLIAPVFARPHVFEKTLLPRVEIVTAIIAVIISWSHVRTFSTWGAYGEVTYSRQRASTVQRSSARVPALHAAKESEHAGTFRWSSRQGRDEH